VALVREKESAQAAFPGRNGLIAFSKDRAIYTVKPNGRKLKQLTETPTTCCVERNIEPAFSRDGTRIAWTRVDLVRDEAGQLVIRSNIWVMNADGTGKKQVTNMGGGGANNPTFSPDGNKVAFRGWDGDSYQIFWKEVDGTQMKQLTNTVLGAGDPDWSPDGTRIAFASSLERDTQNIFAIRPDGTGWEQITNFGPTPENESTPEQASDPDWSPDNRWIVFGVDDIYHNNQNRIDSIRADGTDHRVLFRAPQAGMGPSYPVFSPNGIKILFSPLSEANRACTLRSVGTMCTMNLDGTEVTNTRVVGSDPDWAPKPRTKS
jgi:Tol biopolymer transport system component